MLKNPVTPVAADRAPGGLIEAKGVTGRITFDGWTITIERSGFARMAGPSPHITLDTVSGVRWSRARPGLTRGHIEIVSVGRVNTLAGQVIFTPKQQPQFKRLRDAVQQAIAVRGPIQPRPVVDVVDERPKTAPARVVSPVPAQVQVQAYRPTGLEKWSARLDFVSMTVLLLYLVLPLVIFVAIVVLVLVNL